MKSKYVDAARVAWNVLVTVALATADAIITLSLMRKGARPKPGVRTAWRKGLREDLLRKQRGRCVYCRSRLFGGNTHIDHVTPVNQGGSNDDGNLQLLCSGCNLRKSDRNDVEFRSRYRSLLPQQRGATPSRRIKQQEFRALTQRTADADTYTRFKAGKYLTPKQKIGSGALATGVVVAILIFFPINETFNPGDASALLLSSLGVGAVAGVGVRFRAWKTGRDQED